MKIKVKLPHGYARAKYVPERGFIRSMPTFEIEGFHDNGDKIVELPQAVNMGPDMYDFLKRIVPNLAARYGEDLEWEGKVENKPRSSKEKYAYYGFNTGMGPNAAGLNKDGYGLLGTGETEFPSAQRFGKDPVTGRPNFIYSVKLDAPSATGSSPRSQVLTNILNESHDFSPLLGPVYDFDDPEWDAKNMRSLHDKSLEVAPQTVNIDKSDSDNYYNFPFEFDPAAVPETSTGPRPTDHWVPRNNKDGTPMINPETGKRVWMPVPLVQDLPIYNFEHPAWKDNPYKAWDMLEGAKPKVGDIFSTVDDEPFDNDALNQDVYEYNRGRAKGEKHQNYLDFTKDNYYNPIDNFFDFAKWGTAPTYADFTGKIARHGKPGDPDEKRTPKTIDYMLVNTKLGDRPGYFEHFPDFKKHSRDEWRKRRGELNQEKLAKNREEEVNKREAVEHGLRDIHNFRKDAKTHVFSSEHNTKKGMGYKDMRDFYKMLIRNAFLNGKNKEFDIPDESRKEVLDFIKPNFEKYNKAPSDDAKAIMIFRDYVDHKTERDKFGNIISALQEPFSGND